MNALRAFSYLNPLQFNSRRYTAPQITKRAHMGFWSRLFGPPSAPMAQASAPNAIRLPGPGLFSLEAVGESKYQAALARICGGVTADGVDLLTEATLIHEDANPYDSQAVRVDINGKTVGYLSRTHARQFRREMAKAGNTGCDAICAARIRGGWDRGTDDRGSFGVRLDVAVLRS